MASHRRNHFVVFLPVAKSSLFMNTITEGFTRGPKVECITCTGCLISYATGEKRRSYTTGDSRSLTKEPYVLQEVPVDVVGLQQSHPHHLVWTKVLSRLQCGDPLRG